MVESAPAAEGCVAALADNIVHEARSHTLLPEDVRTHEVWTDERLTAANQHLDQPRKEPVTRQVRILARDVKFATQGPHPILLASGSLGLVDAAELDVSLLSLQVGAEKTRIHAATGGDHQGTQASERHQCGVEGFLDFFESLLNRLALKPVPLGQIEEMLTGPELPVLGSRVRPKDEHPPRRDRVKALPDCAFSASVSEEEHLRHLVGVDA